MIINHLQMRKVVRGSSHSVKTDPHMKGKTQMKMKGKVREYQ